VTTRTGERDVRWWRHREPWSVNGLVTVITVVPWRSLYTPQARGCWFVATLTTLTSKPSVYQSSFLPRNAVLAWYWWVA